MENLPGRGFGSICSVCLSFAWEIVRDSPLVNIVSQTMNKHNSLSKKYVKVRPGHRRQSLCCLEMQNGP